jgi:predicted metal-dependent HD superfamily phosphohydrolase/deoxyadenosine/deoxycytidine kinase
MKIVVTGNIGCGKTTIVKKIVDRLYGYVSYSYDDMVSSAYEIPAIIQRLLTNFGTANKAELSAMAFTSNDATILTKLHQIIGSTVDRSLNMYLTDSDKRYPKVIVEYPLFFELGHHVMPNIFTISVECDASEQISRVRNRDQVDEQIVLNKMNRQLDPAVKSALADFVINTSHDVDAQLDKLIDLIMVRDLKDKFFTYRTAAWLPIWETIQTHYSEPTRYYHTMSHLAHMIYELEKISSKLDGRMVKLIEDAIWYHDLVMNFEGNPGIDNEGDSIKLMKKLYMEHVPNSYIHSVYGYSLIAVVALMIYTTKQHKITSPILLNQPDLLLATQIFLDLDLAIFSESSVRLNAYDEQIRREYKIFSDDAFAEGRAKVLRSFLDRPKIYLSKHLEHKEAAARENLNKLLKWTYF